MRRSLVVLSAFISTHCPAPAHGPAPNQTKAPASAAGNGRLPSSESILDAMARRYLEAQRYEDSGTIRRKIISWNDSQPVRDSRGVFSTAFDRAHEQFRFDVKTATPINLMRTLKLSSTAWRTGPGPIHLWSSEDPVVRDLSIGDALSLLSRTSGGASDRIPALLMGNKSWLVAELKLHVTKQELVGAKCAYVVSGATDKERLSLWIACDDHALLKAVESKDIDPTDAEWQHVVENVTRAAPAERREQTAATMQRPQSHTVESTVEYKAAFEPSFAPDRFAFEPKASEPPRDRCAGRGVVADGSDALIDDIADGDIFLRSADHRNGRWWVYGDDGCHVTPEPPYGEAPGGKNPDRFAMHVSASECNLWGFGIGFALNEGPARCAYDATAYDGIYFWARAGKEAVEINFYVGLRMTQPIEYGGDGTCEASGRKGCWGSFSAKIALDPNWKAYAYRWADLQAPDWTPPLTFDAREITSLGWQATSASPKSERQIWIGRVGFFKGAPPKAPF